MMPPTSIDGTDITGATIDGTDVQEITVDGQTVFTSDPWPQAGLLHNYSAKSLQLANNDTVTQWPDLGPEGDDLSISGSPQFKTNLYNGGPAVEFTSGEEGTSTFSNAITSSFDVFWVGRMVDISFGENRRAFNLTGTLDDRGVVLLSERYNRNDWTVLYRLSTGYEILNHGGGFGNSDPNNQPDTSKHIFIFGFSPSKVDWIIDDTLMWDTTLDNQAQPGVPPVQGIQMNDDTSGTESSQFAQFMIYDTTSSGYSRSDVKSYLEDEWGTYGGPDFAQNAPNY